MLGIDCSGTACVRHSKASAIRSSKTRASVWKTYLCKKTFWRSIFPGFLHSFLNGKKMKMSRDSEYGFNFRNSKNCTTNKIPSFSLQTRYNIKDSKSLSYVLLKFKAKRARLTQPHLRFHNTNGEHAKENYPFLQKCCKTNFEEHSHELVMRRNLRQTGKLACCLQS